MRGTGVTSNASSVFLADSTPMGCELLATALSRNSSVRVVGWEFQCDAALSAIFRLKPDVALVNTDLQDGPGRGLSLIRALRMSDAETRAVVLLDRVEQEAVIAAFRAGARGIFSRATGLVVLPKCIKRVSEGQVWASSTELTYLLDAASQTVPSRTLSTNCCKLLTQREQEVVQLVTDGFSNREIAAELKLSQHTVKNYLFQIFDKIGVSNRVELVLFSLSTPVVDAPVRPQRMAAPSQRISLPNSA